MPSKTETKKGGGARGTKPQVKSTAGKTKAPKISMGRSVISEILKPEAKSPETKNPERKHTAPHVETIASALKTQTPTDITDEMISRRAYHIWIEEGRPDGRSHEHWSRALRELRG